MDAQMVDDVASFPEAAGTTSRSSSTPKKPAKGPLGSGKRPPNSSHQFAPQCSTLLSFRSQKHPSSARLSIKTTTQITSLSL
eukprot:scaffold10571_cov130-Skeletonema_marinoi.AAC.5